MANKPSHSIQSVIFDVNLPEREEVEVFAQSLSSIDIEHTFERIFDEYNHLKNTISIESITLDLGNVGYDDFEEKLKEALAIKLSLIVDTQINQSSFSETLNQEEIELESLIEFLQFGSIKWLNKYSQSLDIEEIILKNCKIQNSIFKRKIIEILPYRVVQERLIQYVSNHVFRKFYLLYFEEKELDFSIEMIEFFKANFVFKESHLEKFITQILLQNIVLQNRSYDFAEALILQLIEQIKNDRIIETYKQKIILENLKKIQQKYQNESQFLRKIAFLESKLNDLKALDFKGIELKKNLESESNPKSESESESKFESINQTIEIEEENLPNSFLIQNAGLVVVWYHLTLLFKHLGLIENRNFINSEAQMKALKVLDFIVFGEQKTREYGLILNKILLGIEPEEAIDLKTQLTDNEIVMTEEFLKNAIIGQWKILQNTTIKGLRKTFLQRNGKLTRTENGWFLQVEAKGGIDTLLDSLPWGLSLIKLNWMPKPLTIEWKRK